ncbi:hypothetical protein [Nocardia donostiensis]|uniref:hypothetical protein n=1 Tax=Nocardia donostiensis TaxID=1538463 RepID=UPI0015883156|nr:hypothetical protein [Nocardia donostiensis]
MPASEMAIHKSATEKNFQQIEDRPGEAPVIWPDPSPLNEWWDHIMHDRPRPSAAA